MQQPLQQLEEGLLITLRSSRHKPNTNPGITTLHRVYKQKLKDTQGKHQQHNLIKELSGICLTQIQQSVQGFRQTYKPCK